MRVAPAGVETGAKLRAVDVMEARRIMRAMREMEPFINLRAIVKLEPY